LFILFSLVYLVYLFIFGWVSASE